MPPFQLGLCALLFLSLSLVNCFRVIPPSNFISKRQHFLKADNPIVEDGVNLKDLTNIAADATYLRDSVIAWLDVEFIVQSCHRDIALRVENAYIDGRRKGINDLGEMLMFIGSSLENFDLGKSFVGPWDIANRVSDLLMVRMERELCECGYSSGKTPNITASTLIEITENLKSEFSRYIFLRDFVEGDVPFDSVIPVLAIIMGFRPTFDSLHLNETLRPLGWERVRTPADILTLSRPSMSPTIVTLVDPLIAPPTDSSIETWMEARMRCDLPEDPETTDIIIETMVGVEMCKIFNKSDDLNLQRRLLIAKWLYIYGFLTADFPPTERFVPPHLQDE